jgi:hypothetical protein
MDMDATNSIAILESEKPNPKFFSGPLISHPEIDQRLNHALDWSYYRQWHRNHITVGEWVESSKPIKICQKKK